MNVFAKRLKKFRKFLRKNKIDATLFTSLGRVDRTIEYFTGFPQTEESFCCLLIDKNKSTLIVSPLEYEDAREAKVDEIVKLNQPLSKILKELVKGKKLVGIMEKNFSYTLFKKLQKLKLKDISLEVYRMRAIKDSYEIEIIKRLCKKTNRCIRLLEEEIKPGKKENEIARILINKIIEEGCLLSFTPIVTSDERTHLIHPVKRFTNKKIKKFGLVDFGLRYKGYCSDVTVPFAFKLKKEQKRIFDLVERIYQKCINEIKINREAKDLHKIAEDMIKNTGFQFEHALGHGLGLDVYELPRLSERSEDKIKNNMFFTVEPGVYVKGVCGARIENDVLVENGKVKVLTKAKLIKI